jgi:hypothetical protein
MFFNAKLSVEQPKSLHKHRKTKYMKKILRNRLKVQIVELKVGLLYVNLTAKSGGAKGTSKSAFQD